MAGDKIQVHVPPKSLLTLESFEDANRGLKEAAYVIGRKSPGSKINIGAGVTPGALTDDKNRQLYANKEKSPPVSSKVEMLNQQAAKDREKNEGGRSA